MVEKIIWAVTGDEWDGTTDLWKQKQWFALAQIYGDTIKRINKTHIEVLNSSYLNNRNQWKVI